MISGLKAYVWGAVAILSLAALATLTTAAYRAGAASERRAALERSISVLRERDKTDEAVNQMDDPGLCRALGGVWNAGVCG